MVTCEHLTKKYSQVTALDDLSITFETGGRYALLGPNGSGKSTMMKMIAGLTMPDGGRILLDGEPLTWRAKAKIAYMPTEPFYFNYMTCESFGRYYADFFKDFNMEKYMLTIRRMDLDPKAKAKELSSGMMAKLKIAATLSRGAAVLMLDEPLNGIDLIAREQVMDLIADQTDASQTILMSSHLVDELEKLADHAVYIRKGKNVLSGSVQELEQDGKSLSDLYRDIFAGHMEDAGEDK